MPATIPDYPIEPIDEVFRTSADIRRRYGVSDMWIFRRLADDPEFPKPIVVKRRRYWKLSDLLRWERKHLEPAKPARSGAS
jgi:predicted DNA-binding transcriptional regulator AlpA